MYQAALNESGYNHQLTYTAPEPTPPKHNRNRARNITRYNPPFDLSVTTNLGYEFLKLVKRVFNTTHPLHKICNTNTLKLSYSCMPNMKATIDGHNNKLLSEPENNTNKCNCRTKANCPLKGECQTKSVVYQAQVTANGGTESYVGITEGEFKTRYRNHLTSFNNASKKNSTELSKHIWSLKENNTNYNIKWTILSKAKAYSNIGKKCNLCITEKFYILFKPELSSLNSRRKLLAPAGILENTLWATPELLPVLVGTFVLMK